MNSMSTELIQNLLDSYPSQDLHLKDTDGETVLSLALKSGQQELKGRHTYPDLLSLQRLLQTGILQDILSASSSTPTNPVSSCSQGTRNDMNKALKVIAKKAVETDPGDLFTSRSRTGKTVMKKPLCLSRRQALSLGSQEPFLSLTCLSNPFISSVSCFQVR